MINVKRLAIVAVLNNVEIDKPILLPYTKEELIEIFFNEEIDQEGNKYYTINERMNSIQRKIDYSNIPFENVAIMGKDLSNAFGLKINPQLVYKKSLESTSLSSKAEIIGDDNVNQIDLFEGVKVENTKFNGCRNVKINPQTIYDKSLSKTSLAGVDFTGSSFDDVDVWYANFEGSIGAQIDPNKVKNFTHAASMTNVILLDIPDYGLDSYRRALHTSNYQELQEKTKQYQDKFLESIKDQLPPPKPKIEENKEEPPKQKRKWF